jgi:hypothetical protein
MVSSDCNSNDISENEEDDLDQNQQHERVHPSSESNIAKEETKEVRRYKIIVITVLILSAIIFAVFVNFFIRNNEKKAFEKTFHESTIKVFKAIGSSIDRTIIPLDVLSVTFASHARAVNATWPFVTLPDFALRMSKLLPQTDGLIIQSIHLVQPEERDKWGKYTSQHSQWVNESILFQENWDRYHGYISYDWEIYDTIHGDNGDIPKNVRYVHKLTICIFSASFSNICYFFTVESWHRNGNHFRYQHRYICPLIQVAIDASFIDCITDLFCFFY